MADVVTFVSLKGGQGKTTLATHYALYSKSHFFTNDHKSGSEDLYQGLFPPGWFHVIRETDSSLEIEEKSVIDCGGYVDRKIPALIEASELCVIPLTYQSRADVRAFFVTLDAVKKMNDRLLVVLNNTRTKDIPVVDAGIRKVLKDQFPVKVVRQSSYMTYLANEGKNPFTLDETTGVARKALASVREQLSDLFTFIERY